MPNASGPYYRLKYGLAGMQILKSSSYRLEFYFVYSSAVLVIVLEVHFNQLFLDNVYFRVCFVMCKIQPPFFSCRSVLLDISVCT